jgi:hypothetical protein
MAEGQGSNLQTMGNKGKRGVLPLSHDFETYGSGIAYFIKLCSYTQH